MKILYIPFCMPDAAMNLMEKATVWKNQYAKLGKEQPLILCHGAISAEQIPLIAAALLSGPCQIYILGHGINTAELIICNQEQLDANLQLIGIKEVAQRVQHDLGQFAWHPATTIKLYFCDPYGHDKAIRMGESFNLALVGNPNLKGINIHYYFDVKITPPSHFNVEFGLIKQSIKSLEIHHELFQARLDCFAGRARLHRHNLLIPAVFFFVQNTDLIYPVYNHPLLKIIIEQLVHTIQMSPALSGTKNSICQRLIDAFPTDMHRFSPHGDRIANEYFSLHLQLNVELIRHFAEQRHLGFHVEPRPMMGEIHPALEAPEQALAMVDIDKAEEPLAEHKMVDIDIDPDLDEMDKDENIEIAMAPML